MCGVWPVWYALRYDSESLSPLGVVATREQLAGKEVAVIGEGSVLVLCDGGDDSCEVIHPQDDGSYWVRSQRNKMVRIEEGRREAIAASWFSAKAKEVGTDGAPGGGTRHHGGGGSGGTAGEGE